jgi:glycosyltransferase involved in cell wall biosynthesis
MRRRVFASFTSDEMLRESGRLPFALLFPFVRSGYEVVVYDNLRRRLTEYYTRDESDLPETARLSLSMPSADHSGLIPEKADDFIYLYDRPLASAIGRSWRRRIQIRFDLFSPYRLRAPLIAPYGMNPSQALRATPELLAGLRAAPREIRLLFAGDSKGYVRNRVRYPGPKLPRLEVLATLKERLGDSFVPASGADEISRLCDAGFVDRFVLSDSGSGIASSQWLPTLARADFFLCPPGMVMPMCHNVVEAMAVGTIPLIGYPEWLHPNLKHLENCVVFDGKDDLVEKARLVLAMPPAQIAQMRAAVIDYYDRNLRPETLVKAIESRPERDLTVLIYTELNMARHEKKLNRRSVLMRGPDAGGPLRWIGRMVDGRAQSG